MSPLGRLMGWTDTRSCAKRLPNTRRTIGNATAAKPSTSPPDMVLVSLRSKTPSKTQPSCGMTLHLQTQLLRQVMLVFPSIILPCVIRDVRDRFSPLSYYRTACRTYGTRIQSMNHDFPIHIFFSMMRPITLLFVVFRGCQVVGNEEVPWVYDKKRGHKTDLEIRF